VFGALLIGFLAGRLVGIEPWIVVAVVAAATAARTDIAEVLVAAGTWPQALRAAIGANVLNNPPAFLLALPRVNGAANTTALLFGVNAAPTVLVTWSLSGLLWLDAARRHCLDVGPRGCARVG
jgi:Na+/H+ antiporter NhaD/arsenite permease-like protein